MFSYFMEFVMMIYIHKRFAIVVFGHNIKPSVVLIIAYNFDYSSINVKSSFLLRYDLRLSKVILNQMLHISVNKSVLKNNSNFIMLLIINQSYYFYQLQYFSFLELEMPDPLIILNVIERKVLPMNDIKCCSEKSKTVIQID